MITSNRRFGIEIEFVAPSSSAMDKIRNRINVVDDGSLRPLANAGEYVSDVLKGEDGEGTVEYACEVLKKYGAHASDPKTSVHIHLDGQKKNSILRSTKSRKEIPPDVQVWGLSNKLKKTLSEAHFKAAASEGRLSYLSPMGQYATREIDNILYYSSVPLTKPPMFNYTYYWIEREDRFKWLRNVFYFYTQFSEVMEAIVSNSRKCGNMYCIPLGKSYDLEEIEKCNSIDDIYNVWYKGREPGNHYDDSRYHNVNLHSYFERNGTVEIRSHGGTIDPLKILLWVKLHQKIVDKLEDMELEDIKFTSNLYKKFVDFVEEPVLQGYVKRLLGYYSNITVK